MSEELKWIDSPSPHPPQAGAPAGAPVPPLSSWPSKVLTLLLVVGAVVGLLAHGRGSALRTWSARGASVR